MLTDTLKCKHLNKLYGKSTSRSSLAAVYSLDGGQLGRVGTRPAKPGTLITISENLALGGRLGAGREHSERKLRLQQKLKVWRIMTLTMKCIVPTGLTFDLQSQH